MNTDTPDTVHNQKNQADPLIEPFLDFLARELTNHPEIIQCIDMAYGLWLMAFSLLQAWISILILTMISSTGKTNC